MHIDFLVINVFIHKKMQQCELDISKASKRNVRNRKYDFFFK